MNEVLDTHLGDVALVPFFQYHYAAHPIHKEAALSRILALSNTLSVIDCYEALIYSLKSVISAEKTNSEITKRNYKRLQVIWKSIESLQECINSPILNTLGAETQTKQHPKPILASQLSYIYCQYDLAISFAQSEFIENSNNFTSLVTIARVLATSSNNTDLSVINFPKKGIAYEIIKRLVSILNTDNDFENSLIHLLNLTSNFYGYVWADSLFSFIVNFVTHEITKNDIHFVHYSAVGTQFLDLYTIWYFTSKLDKRVLISSFFNKYHNIIKPIINMIEDKAYLQEIQFINNDELSFSKLVNSFVKGDIILGESIASQLSHAEDGIISNTSKRMLCYFLLDKKEIDKCIEFIVTQYISNNRFLIYLPVQKTVDELTTIKFSTNHPLVLSIFLDIYKEIYGGNLERRKKYAYEDFLKKHSINKPSELGPFIKDYKLKEIIYFLRDICTEDLFSKSVTFRSSHEVVRERLLVCKLLIEIDSMNTTVYQDEIKDIQKKIMIRKRMKEIEKSKIYVNSNQLKLVVSKQIKDKYARYISLIKEGIDSEYFAKMEAQMIDTYSKVPKDADAEVYRETLLALDLPKNETYDLFQSIVVGLRDLFVSNTEYGLDGYLSTRIRHGTLSSQIRSVLELNNLITQRIKLEGLYIYQDNEYWISELNISDNSAALTIKSALADFSRRADSIIEKIVSDWVQVKKGSDDKGFFDFTLYRQGIIILSGFVKATTQFDEFIDEVFSQMYEVLENVLEKLRDSIISEIKPEFNLVFDELLKSVNSIKGIGGVVLLNTSINRARSEMQLSLDRIIEWFRLSREFANEPFTVDDSLSISVESIRTLYPDFSANVTISEEVNSVLIGGQYLANYVDIFFIILENIIKHSGYFDQSKANVNCVIHLNSIIINIENQIATEELAAKSKAKLYKIKDYIDKNRSNEYVNIEGGSGFYKIQKIIQYDIPRTKDGNVPILAFGVISNTFSVKIIFPIV